MCRELSPDPGLARRTDVIATEGLLAERKSAVLGVGRGDMRSYGVADNFAFSLYDPAYRVPSPPESAGGAAAVGTPTLSPSGSRGVASLSLSPSALLSPSSAAASATGSPVIYQKPPHDVQIGRTAVGMGGGSPLVPSSSRGSVLSTCPRRCCGCFATTTTTTRDVPCLLLPSNVYVCALLLRAWCGRSCLASE